MKVVVKKKLIEKLADKIAKVKAKNQEIEYIEIDEEELEEMEKDLGQSLRTPNGKGVRKLLGYKVKVVD